MQAVCTKPMAPYWHPKAVLLLSSAACGQRRTYHRQRSGCLGGPSKKSGLATCHFPMVVPGPGGRGPGVLNLRAQPGLGVGSPQLTPRMATPDGPGVKKMQPHSLLRHNQAHNNNRSPDGFRSGLLKKKSKWDAEF